LDLRVIAWKATGVHDKVQSVVDARGVGEESTEIESISAESTVESGALRGKERTGEEEMLASLARTTVAPVCGPGACSIEVSAEVGVAGVELCEEGGEAPRKAGVKAEGVG
jgi:hypothetical protein